MFASFFFLLLNLTRHQDSRVILQLRAECYREYDRYVDSCLTHERWKKALRLSPVFQEYEWEVLTADVFNCKEDLVVEGSSAKTVFECIQLARESLVEALRSSPALEEHERDRVVVGTSSLKADQLVEGFSALDIVKCVQSESVSHIPLTCICDATCDCRKAC